MFAFKYVLRCYEAGRLSYFTKFSKQAIISSTNQEVSILSFESLRKKKSHANIISSNG